MRAGLPLAAITGLMLATAAPPAALSARATPAAMCGVGIIEVSMCVDWMMKRREHTELVAKARAGDAKAASTLANFHGLAGEEAIGRRWQVVAAERGDCWAIDRMRDEAKRRGDKLARGKWETRWRWNQCKLA